RRDQNLQPRALVPVGHFIHDCEKDAVFRSAIENIPYFNAPVYFENKSVLGKIDEIFGSVNEVYFSVARESKTAAKLKKGEKIFISEDKILPKERFLNPQVSRPVQRRPHTQNTFRGGRGNYPPRGASGNRRFPTQQNARKRTYKH
ncbi:MAG: H/ACA ribonucleoprotein complex subunit 1, partial [Amphiamblys sp. WSBS2006]